MQQPKRDRHGRAETADGKPLRVQTRVLTVSMFPSDFEMLDYIISQLGTNRSDAVRTCIRTYYAILKS